MASQTTKQTKKKKYKYKHMKEFVIFMAVFLTILIVAMVFRYIKIKKNVFVYKDHLDDIVMTVAYKKAPKAAANTAGEMLSAEAAPVTMSLREYGYYIFDVEGFIQRQAIIYNEEDPTQYWKTHYSAGMESNFMNLYAAKLAKGSCLQDIVYYQLALADGFALTDDEIAENEKSAMTTWKGMSEAQREILGIDYEMVLRVKERRAIAKAYAREYASTHNVTGFGGTPEEVLSYDGNFFKQIILPDFDVTYNDEVLDKIDMGRITVNRE